jgi:hypothetical protein
MCRLCPALCCLWVPARFITANLLKIRYFLRKYFFQILAQVFQIGCLQISPIFENDEPPAALFISFIFRNYNFIDPSLCKTEIYPSTPADSLLPAKSCHTRYLQLINSPFADKKYRLTRKLIIPRR